MDLVGRHDDALRVDDPRPELLIPGFPKCGTTSLHDWLTAHPDVAAPPVKEPHFFSEPDYRAKRDEAGLPTHRTDGLDAYRTLWEGASATQLRLDATPFYAYYPSAVAVLTAPPAPLAVFVVRRPSHRVYSLYRALQYRAGRLPDSVGFDEFVSRVRVADPALVDGDTQVRDCIVHSDYRRWIEPWRDAAGPERTMVVTLDRLRGDPRSCLTHIAGATGLDPSGFPDELPTANPARRARSRRLARARLVVGRSRHGRGVIGRRVRRVLRRAHDTVNLDDTPRPPTDSDLAAMADIDAELAPSVDWLASIGVEVGGWR